MVFHKVKRVWYSDSVRSSYLDTPLVSPQTPETAKNFFYNAFCFGKFTSFEFYKGTLHKLGEHIDGFFGVSRHYYYS
ncbi:hypothetical protein PBCV1_a300R [Paramecium bursaria Chlorella virus 1]|uniref:Uncharacterized protein n=1 Tax=Paramecium bursaria Chlorella virus 1 TaxID=10506 RepID=Q84616_PBCV1|nr:hypothetical protein PBCV1_a300R [Paramecium bursaria Chlorella virus 1]AAC96668.1 hypothetical protein [Paramecium bursaria Chlorella virus 1]